MSKRQGQGGEEGVGKEDHYCTTCLVALTDRLECAAVSAGQRQSASERERYKRGKKRKTVQNKRYKLSAQQHGWDRQEEVRRETQEAGFWSWQHWAAGKASISHLICLNLATEYNYRAIMSMKAVNDGTEKNVSPYCVWRTCNLCHRVLLGEKWCNHPCFHWAPLLGIPLWLAPVTVHLCHSLVIPLYSPQLACVILCHSMRSLTETTTHSIHSNDAMFLIGFDRCKKECQNDKYLCTQGGNLYFISCHSSGNIHSCAEDRLNC